MPTKTTAKKSRLQRICDLASHPRTGQAERNLAVQRLAHVAKIGPAAHQVDALTATACDYEIGEAERMAAVARLVNLAQDANSAKPKPDSAARVATPFFERWYGKKYDSSLRPVNIAKLVREEIKFARKIGSAPADGALALAGMIEDAIAAAPASIKFSVRTRDYNVITITLSGVPQEWGWVWLPEGTWRAGWPHWDHTEALKTLIKQLEGMLNAYNYDGSNAMFDHFDTNFYGRVEVDWSERPHEAPAR